MWISNLNLCDKLFQMEAYQSLKFDRPTFLLDEARLLENLTLIKSVKEASGAKIILALKGFAFWRVFPMINQYLDGATASSLNEAQLIFEEMGEKAHAYAVAYEPREFDQYCQISSHITFNSLRQFEQFRPIIRTSFPEISLGLRVNPRYQGLKTTDLYNPSNPGSRLGMAVENLPSKLPEEIEGLHFHVLCESDASDLVEVLRLFESGFKVHFPRLKWVNFGGGHLMTRKGYDVEKLISAIKSFKEKYDLEVILEPGSAIAWDCGPLVAKVLDIVEDSGIKTAILNVSFTAHMPDTLEMPYRPRVLGTVPVENAPHQYRLGGNSCLAGDYMDVYGFEAPLKIGDQIILMDMMHYTMVKTSFFNGVQHPDIAILKKNGEIQTYRTFTYEDYKSRLG